MFVAYHVYDEPWLWVQKGRVGKRPFLLVGVANMLIYRYDHDVLKDIRIAWHCVVVAIRLV